MSRFRSSRNRYLPKLEIPTNTPVRSRRLWLILGALIVTMMVGFWDDRGALAQNAAAPIGQSASQSDVTAEDASANATPGASSTDVAEIPGEVPPTPAEAEGSAEAAGETAHAEAGEHAEGEHNEGGHHDPVAPLLAAIVLILFFAKVAGDLFERVGLPAVLGELTVGIVLGNLVLISGGIAQGLIAVGFDIDPAWAQGWHVLDFLKAPAEAQFVHPYNVGATLKMLAGIGVVLLLFEVGLESSVGEMMKVGGSAMIVAVLGVVTPMILGMGVGWWLLNDPDVPDDWQIWLFLGATLCATSVGITARVLKDLGRSQQRESQIILGAAVIDDVLGLIVLTVVTGIINQGSNFEIMSLFKIIGASMAFLIGSVVLGTRLLTRPLFKAASFLRGHGLLVSTALVICFGFAYLAAQVELAPIVGAFAAGLILEHAHYRELGQKENVELEEALAPLTALLVPIFFVQMGIEVKLSSFADPSVWMLAGAITIAAIIGKQVCALGILEKGLNRLAVGLGMIPRGEVGLIFAGVGLSLRVDGEAVVNAELYSAIVVMVILTTMITPPLLKWAMDKKTPAPAETPAAS